MPAFVNVLTLNPPPLFAATFPPVEDDPIPAAVEPPPPPLPPAVTLDVVVALDACLLMLAEVLPIPAPRL